MLLLVTRMLAPGAPGPLTAVGYLISRSSAEDNAKWLNAAAELASGAPVDAWANVGGPLLLLLTLAATLIAATSELLYGGLNEVAVSAGTPILGEMLLIVLAPFALSPLIEARIRRTAAQRPQPVPWPLLLLGVAVLVTAVTLLLNYGHLTLQFTLLVLTLWVSAFLTWRRAQGALLLTTIAVITTAEVWFPLNVVALVLLLGLIALGVAGVVRRQRTRESWLLIGGAVVLRHPHVGLPAQQHLRTRWASTARRRPSAVIGAAKGVDGDRACRRCRCSPSPAARRSSPPCSARSPCSRSSAPCSSCATVAGAGTSCASRPSPSSSATRSS